MHNMKWKSCLLEAEDLYSSAAEYNVIPSRLLQPGDRHLSTFPGHISTPTQLIKFAASVVMCAQGSERAMTVAVIVISFSAIHECEKPAI
jgi:hypothetical protein